MGAIIPSAMEMICLSMLQRQGLNVVYGCAIPNLRTPCANSHLKNQTFSYRPPQSESQKPGCSQISYPGVLTWGLPQDHVEGSNG